MFRIHRKRGVWNEAVTTPCHTCTQRVAIQRSVGAPLCTNLLCIHGEKRCKVKAEGESSLRGGGELKRLHFVRRPPVFAR
jgi:hypothetical protein